MVMTLKKIRLDMIDEVFQNVPNTEELSGSGTKGNVGAGKVVDGSLGEHSVVLQLRLAQRGAVTRDQDKLSWRTRGDL